MTRLFPLTLLCILLVCSVLNAQSPKGSFDITTGIGIIPTYTGKNAHTEIPALSIQAGYRVSENFSLNGYVGFSASTSTPKLLYDGIDSQISNKTTMLGLKGILHKNFTEKIEMYGGMLLGYSFFNTKETDMNTGLEVVREPGTPTPYDPNAPKGQVLYSGFVGAKFWFKPKASVFAEFGYGISIMNLGFSFRIK